MAARQGEREVQAAPESLRWTRLAPCVSYSTEGPLGSGPAWSPLASQASQLLRPRGLLGDRHVLRLGSRCHLTPHCGHVRLCRERGRPPDGRSLPDPPTWHPLAHVLVTYQTSGSSLRHPFPTLAAPGLALNLPGRPQTPSPQQVPNQRRPFTSRPRRPAATAPARPPGGSRRRGCRQCPS